MSAAMTAAPSYRLDTRNFTVTLGATHPASVTRYIEVSFAIGRLSSVVIRRERADNGEACGSIALCGDALPALRLGLGAAAQGERGRAGFASLAHGGISFDVPYPGALEIGLTDEGGLPRGRPSLIRGAELERLAEALCIAESEP